AIDFFKLIYKNGLIGSYQEARKYLIEASVKRNSNDNSDNRTKGYPMYNYQGWSTSFETVGNPYALCGNWYIINGLGGSFYQTWLLKSITHTFNNSWSTSYDLDR